MSVIYVGHPHRKPPNGFRDEHGQLIIKRRRGAKYNRGGNEKNAKWRTRWHWPLRRKLMGEKAQKLMQTN